MTRTISSLLALGVLATASGLQAQATDPVLERIQHEARENSQLYRLGQALMDSIGPRLTGAPGMDRAHEWAVQQYGAWGIDARNEQYGTWTAWDRGITHVDLLSPRVRTLEAMSLAWSPGTSGPVEGEVAVVPELASAGEAERWLGTVRGRFVAIDAPQTTCRAPYNLEEFGRQETLEGLQATQAQTVERWRGTLGQLGTNVREVQRRLEAAGAAGILTSNWSGGWGTRRIFNAFTEEVPVLSLSCEDYGLVVRLAENGQGPRLRVNAETEFLGETAVFNTVARIPGTERPDEYVILSAHFDSWDGSSGATDNGTGTITMMEVMRILQEVLPNPRRTILVGHWGGEEQGLNGSRAFVADNPGIVDGVQVVLNQDNGTGRIRNISMQGFTGVHPYFERWLPQVPTEAAGEIEVQAPGMPSSGGSDHAAFVCAGVPSFMLSSLSWDYFTYTWHTDRDTFDKLIFDDLTDNVITIASLAYQASELDERLPRDRQEPLLNPRTGEEMEWPRCQPPHRSADESPRM
jgi:carboxypeptidase Q